MKKNYSKQIGLILFSLTFNLAVIAQWQPTTNITYNSKRILAVATAGNSIYAGASPGFNNTIDNGNSWASSLTSLNIASIAVFGSRLIAATGSGIHISTDNGISWDTSNTGLGVLDIRTVFVHDSDIFCGASEGIYISTDSGETWLRSDNGLPAHTDINAMTSIGSVLFASSYSTGIYRSDDNGANWVPANNGFTNPNTLTITSAGTMLYAGALSTGVFVSLDSGTSWTPANTGLMFTVHSLAVQGNVVFAGTDWGLYSSRDSGSTWLPADNGLASLLTTVYALTLGGSDIYAGTEQGMAESVDSGLTWSLIGLPVNCSTTILHVDQNELWQGTNNRGIQSTTTQGNNWTPLNNGLYPNSNIKFLTFTGDSCYAIANHSLFFSGDHGNTWDTIFVSTNSDAVTFAKIGSTLFLGTSGHGNHTGGIYLSTNNGASWIQSNSGWPSVPTNYDYQIPSECVPFAQNIFTSNEDGVYVSSNNGGNWSQSSSGLPLPCAVRVLEKTPYGIYAGIDNYGVYFSVDGTQWIAKNSGFISFQYFTSFCHLGATIFAGTMDGLMVSPDSGNSWIDISNGLPDFNIKSLALDSTYLYAATNSKGIWRLPLSVLANIVHVENNKINHGSFKLYPNPAKNNFILEVKDHLSEAQIAIINLTGQTLYQSALTSGKMGIDCSGFPSGIYLIQLTNDQESTYQKIVIY